ncbi:N-acetyltransferase family protein [Gordonia sp. ABSL1-1]|uniref:GNAT family N-acetyltransferase n=1 Tax=Gordonia sp. ABSL1-1 TaxID=3053923 RepID=UPI0025723CB8|nr:GNAT family N-acetyltransferase [Gordonia sp. ABSL1-1]MDL9938490.1 N-acetyltransferase family protein [Gordonia sp. ABSL1-1]
MSTAEIRPAGTADLPGVADIYRHYVENTVATFDYAAQDVAHWEAKLRSIEAAGRPFVVAVLDDEVVGFAYLGPFREKQAYDWTAEDTIYVRPGFGGRGIGAALMARLLADADPDNVRTVIAVIAATGGEPSVALHARFGFTEVGRLRTVGYKAEQWIDCIYMQRELSARN